MPQAFSSPRRIASAVDFAWAKVECGGIGGTSGSQRMSSTVGRFADSAASQAGPIASGVSTFTPPRPRPRAKAA
jgi:hypothetical protein